MINFTTKANVANFGTIVAYDTTVLAPFCPLCWQPTSEHTGPCEYNHSQNDLPIRVWAGYNYDWEGVLVQDIEIQLLENTPWSTINLWELVEILDGCLQNPGCYDLRDIRMAAINNFWKWKDDHDLYNVDPCYAY